MKKRVVSAVFMVLLLIPFLILGNVPFALFIAVLGMLAIKELLNLKENIPVVLKVICYIVGEFFMLFSFQNNTLKAITDYRVIGGVFFLFTSFMVINGNIDKYNYKDSLWLFSIVLITGILFSNIIYLRDINLYSFIYVLLISTITDTFALFCGKYFGKHKLSTNISPNKTIEGSLGGSIFGTIVSVLFYLFFINKSVNIALLILITFILTIVGQIGDLFFSSIKRHHQIKDFSNLIPGHGGILDRVDSLLFVTYGYLLLMFIL